MAQQLLMPRATAMWLVENTSLTFDQIAAFCALHPLEVKAMADGEVGTQVQPINPVLNGQLTQDELDRCQKDPRTRLAMRKTDLPQPVMRAKGPKYTPVTKRNDKPNGVSWLLKTHPELGDSQIARLLGTTKDTIQKVRDRSHWNAANIKPNNPVLAGLRKQVDLDAALKRARRKQERLGKSVGTTVDTSTHDVAEYDEAIGE